MLHIIEVIASLMFVVALCAFRVGVRLPRAWRFRLPWRPLLLLFCFVGASSAFAADDNWARNLQCFEVVPAAGGAVVRVNRCSGESWTLYGSTWYPLAVSLTERVVVKHGHPALPLIEEPKAETAAKQ